MVFFETDHGLSYSREYLAALVPCWVVSANQVNPGIGLAKAYHGKEPLQA
jgi:hypothetical protein